MNNWWIIPLRSGSTKSWCWIDSLKQFRWFTLKYPFGLHIKGLINLKNFLCNCLELRGPLQPLPPPVATPLPLSKFHCSRCQAMAVVKWKTNSFHLNKLIFFRRNVWLPQTNSKWLSWNTVDVAPHHAQWVFRTPMPMQRKRGFMNLQIRHFNNLR